MNALRLIQMMIGVLLGFSVLAKPTWAEEIPQVFEPPIKAGAMISVEKYNPKSQTYLIAIVKEPGVGPNVAMPGDLVDAISTLDLEKLKQRPEYVVGNTYHLDKELRLISEKGLELRARLLKKNKK